MKNVNYVSDLIPVISKDQIHEELETVKSVISKTVEPEFSSAASLFRGDKFKSKEISAMSETFKRIVGNSDGMVEYLNKNLSVIEDNLDKIQSIVDVEVSPELAAASVSFKNATMLQFIEYSDFVAQYSRRLLNLIYIRETQAEASEDITGDLRDAEASWMKDNFLAFCDAVRVVTTPTTKLIKILEDLPEVAVNADTFSSLRGQMGINKIDPLKLGFISARRNLIFKARMLWVEREATKFKAAKTEKQLLELRRMRLLRQREGKSDARLDQEIKRVEMQLSDVIHFIEKKEKTYG